MNDVVSFPYTITRGAQLRLIIPVLLASPFFILAVLFIQGAVIIPREGQDFPLLLLVLVILIPMEAAAAWVLLKSLQPATLTFNPGYISVKPLPVLGFSAVAAQEHRLADFKAAVLQPVETKGYVKFSLTKPMGKPLLLSGHIKQDLAEQLAAQLGLKIERL